MTAAPQAGGRSATRLAVLMSEDINRDPAARTKYGLLVEALSRRFDLVDVYDVSLRGFARLANALRVFHPDAQRWRQHFRKNVAAFRARSKRAAARLRTIGDRCDVVLQVNTMFDSLSDTSGLAGVIYTDYTAKLSARRPDSGRSPLRKRQLQEWLRLESAAYHRAAHICTRSAFVRESMLADYELPHDRVSAIGGGLNLAALPAGPPPSPAQAVLFIGKDFYRKGGDVLLRAFDRAGLAAKGWKLLLLTADPVPAELPREGVELIPPTWNRKSIEALYRRASVFVLPSRLETWGDVLLEAMAHGMACVGVSGEAMPEILDHGRAGIVVDPENVDALTAALARLGRDTTLRRELGRKALDRVRTHYTWDTVADRLATTLESVARQGSARNG